MTRGTKTKRDWAFMSSATECSEEWTILDATTLDKAKQEARENYDHSYLTKGDRIKLPKFTEFQDIEFLIDHAEDMLMEQGLGRYYQTNFSLNSEQREELGQMLNAAWKAFFDKHPKCFNDNFYLRRENGHIISLEDTEETK